MKIQVGNENHPLVMFQHELEEIIKCDLRREMICIYMYIQLMKLHGMETVPDALLIKAFGSKIHEAVDSLVEIGLLKKITVEVTLPDGSGKRPITELDYNHKFPGQVIQYELIKETIKEVMVEKKVKKERVKPSEQAFAMSEKWIWYINDRCGKDASRQRYGNAMQFQKMFELICDTPDNIVETFDWYIKNYRNNAMLPIIDNIWKVHYKYILITSAKNAIQKRSEDVVV